MSSALTPSKPTQRRAAGGWSMGIVIPARNEAAGIARCLRSLHASLNRAGWGIPAWIVVVADHCSDDTAALARQALGAFGEVLEVDVRSAGAARRLGTDAVLAHFEHTDPRTLWLANTDADSHVCADWVTSQLDLADHGVTGIAGIVRLDDEANAAAHADYRAHYRIESDGSHAHVHGANLGVRADAYLDAGGWHDRALAEDHCLWERLRDRGWVLIASSTSAVVTSARLRGRASGGFADSLKARLDRCAAAVVAS